MASMTPSVIMSSVIMLIVIMLTVIMPSVILPNVMAPRQLIDFVFNIVSELSSFFLEIF